MKKIINEGTPGTAPQRSSNCKIKYTCTLEDGTLIEQADCLELQVGDCEVKHAITN